MSGGKRPESSIAQSFAADLDSMFGLSTGEMRSNELNQALSEQKQTLTSKAAELEELEAKLKATEERLAKSRNASPARQANVGASRLPPSQQQQTTEAGQKPGHPLAQKPTYPPDRPPTAREDTQTMMSHMPGHMPPSTPSEYNNASNEYVVVDSHASGAAR